MREFNCNDSYHWASLLGAADDNAINLDLNVDAILPDRVHLKRRKDPDKMNARYSKDKAELENVMCRSNRLDRVPR